MKRPSRQTVLILVLTLGLIGSLYRLFFGDDYYTGNHPVGTGKRVTIIGQG